MNPRRIRATANAALARLALIGADPRDDDDLRERKALLVVISILILPVSAVWGTLYLAFGSPVGVVPWIYFVILLGAIVVFSRTRNFAQLLRVGQVDILFAPTLSMIPLGGFIGSGGVGFWAILAPLGALVFCDVRDAARWFVAFLVERRAGSRSRAPRTSCSGVSSIASRGDRSPSRAKARSRRGTSSADATPRPTVNRWCRRARDFRAACIPQTQ